MEYLFWISLFIVFYTYIGYGMILFPLASLFGSSRKAKMTEPFDLPAVTFLVAAYNERDWIREKILNSLALDYPPELLSLHFVTDGSDDGTPEIIRQTAAELGVDIRVDHQAARQGKIAAVHRVMPTITSPIVIFSDANTLLNPLAIKHIVRHYEDPQVGGVAGEKRIRQSATADASKAGEGIYWKYESLLKKWDARLYSVVGAAGELFSIRTHLYEHIPTDTIIEDFYLTLRIAQRGYRIMYESEAYATETASASVAEELKRKIRIAAGGLQAISRLTPLLNIFRYGWLSFQYISHRVLRWTLAPLSLPLLLISSSVLASQGNVFYQLAFAGQILFYLAAILGWRMERKKLRYKLLFVPYYFCVMNYAVYRGFGRLLAGRQSVLWERAKRAEA